MKLPETDQRVWQMPQETSRGTWWHENANRAMRQVLICTCGSHDMIGGSKTIHCNSCGRIWDRQQLERAGDL